MPNDEIRLTDPICEPQVSKMWPVGDVWFLILATRPSVQSTDPFKKKIISFIEELTKEASISNSVNTIYIEKDKLIGHNTDIAGFELAIRHSKYDAKNKVAFILGAGGVVSSLIIALKNLEVSKIYISNRTKESFSEREYPWSEPHQIWSCKNERDIQIGWDFSSWEHSHLGCGF